MEKKANNIPTWINTAELISKSADAVKDKSNYTVELPTGFTTVASYECNTCRLPFTTGMIGPQLKKAARNAQSYIECPKCSGFLVEKTKTIVKRPESLISQSDRKIDKNTPIQRGINTWVDKAIYGKLVQAIADYVGNVGISNPQLKFQRGLRASKFPGEPMSAKGAEFTCEFVDESNTRNRILITAGLTPEGKFIYPRTFKTMSGNEYPLTSLAISDFTGGKVFEPVVPDHSIPPLNYRYPDYTRFREISANTTKIVKKAMDNMSDPPPGGLNMSNPPINTDMPHDMYSAKQMLNNMGITEQRDPAMFNKMLNILQQGESNTNIEDQEDQGNTAQPSQMGAVPNASNPSGVQPGAFMNGVGLSSRKMADIMNSAPQIDDNKLQVLADIIQKGLSFEEAYTEMRQHGMPLTQQEYDIAGQALTVPDSEILAEAIADKLIKEAELQQVKRLRVTAEDVKNRNDLSTMTSVEANKWVDTFVDTFNNSLSTGKGLVTAEQNAFKTANDSLANSRIKVALRDKNTLFPFTDPDPEYSLAQQTKDSEPRFDMKYDETDGGIQPFENRNVSQTFRGSTPELGKEASIKRAMGLDMDPGMEPDLGMTEDMAEIDPSEDIAETAARDIPEEPTNVSNEQLLDYIKILQAEIESLKQDTIEESEESEESEELAPEMESGLDFYATDMRHNKYGESTGTELAPDDIGQNPINMSRYKTLVQDYLRAGNIPPTKVDLHKLKDGGYTLDELKKLVETVQTKDENAIYPTTHANIENVKKLALDTLSDMYKEMPAEKEIIAPVEDYLTGGLADNDSPSEFDPKELEMGIPVEMEHTNNPEIAREIAMDHLRENPHYYTWYNKIEQDNMARAAHKVLPKDTDALLTRLKYEATRKVFLNEK